MRILLRLSVVFLFITIMTPCEAESIMTTFGGETITWDITGIGNITSQGCNGSQCYYVAILPPVPSEVAVSASINPSVWGDYGNWLQIYNIPAGDRIETPSCTPLYPPICPATFSLSDSTLFFPDKPVLPYSFLSGGSFLISYGRAHPDASISIHVDLFNNSPFTIPARPDLKGDKNDHPCTKFKKGRSPGS